MKIITDLQFNGFDPSGKEYTCTSCWKVCLSEGDKFCSNCGEGLLWKIPDINGRTVYTEQRMDINWEKYGNAIGDHEGELRNITEIISELEEIQRHFSTHAMSDHALFLQGRAEMLKEVINYLHRV